MRGNHPRTDMAITREEAIGIESNYKCGDCGCSVNRETDEYGFKRFVCPKCAHSTSQTCLNCETYTLVRQYKAKNVHTHRCPGCNPNMEEPVPDCNDFAQLAAEAIENVGCEELSAELELQRGEVRV